MDDSTKTIEQRFSERLAARGFRATSQREHVYNVLLEERDHPTAEQVFLRTKKVLPEISMATVYNCLDALVKSGLVREVNVDRTAMRYCPNMQEHCHFYCEECAGIYDIPLQAPGSALPVSLPEDFQPAGFELSIRGVCPQCVRQHAQLPDLP